MVETSDILIMAGFFVLAGAVITLILSLGGGDTNNPISGQPTYTIDGQVVLAGSGDGATIKEDTFQDQTRESILSLSVLGPESLSFTGAENLDAQIKLIKNGQIVDRYTETIQELPLGEEQTLDFKFGRKPAGTYTVQTNINFECTLITLSCKNSDSFETQITVPKRVTG